MEETRNARSLPIPPNLSEPEGTVGPFVPLRLVLQPTGDSIVLTRGDAIIGRHSEADVRLPLPDVSRRHCRLVHREGIWHLHDLKSLNGTFLNNQTIDHALIRHGDILRVGGFTFEVDLAGAPRDAAPTSDEDNVLLSITRALPTPAPGDRLAS